MRYPTADEAVGDPPGYLYNSSRSDKHIKSSEWELSKHSSSFIQLPISIVSNLCPQPPCTMDVARHPAASCQPTSTHKPVSRWLPSQRPGIQQWLACKLCEARERTDLKLDSSLVSFKEIVNSDPTWENLSNDMFTQWSKNYDTGAEAALESFDDFIEVMNIIVQSPASFFDRHGPPPAMWMIGFPINAVLDWPMGTLAGYEFWLIPAINASFRNILNTWTCFLRSSAS